MSDTARPQGQPTHTRAADSGDKSDGYFLGSYRIATAPEPNSSRLTSFRSTHFENPANNDTEGVASRKSTDSHRFPAFKTSPVYLTTSHTRSLRPYY